MVTLGTTETIEKLVYEVSAAVEGAVAGFREVDDALGTMDTAHETSAGISASAIGFMTAMWQQLVNEVVSAAKEIVFGQALSFLLCHFPGLIQIVLFLDDT